MGSPRKAHGNTAKMKHSLALVLCTAGLWAVAYTIDPPKAGMVTNCKTFRLHRQVLLTLITYLI